jgi:dienelactone hydrolase
MVPGHSSPRFLARLTTCPTVGPTVCLAFCLAATAVLQASEPWGAIPRRLPPEGMTLEPGQFNQLSERLERARQALQAVPTEDATERADWRPDIEVFLKAVDFALRNGEFYDPRDVRRAQELLAEADRRTGVLAAGSPDWPYQKGLVVRGFRSRIDHSVQPYGLVIPEDHDPETPAPLYVWLHGRGDKTTDLHFIHQRMRQVGQIAPAGALVVHPFGRHCLGFKSAGETDVLEAIEHVQSHYAIDPDRIVLMGFSMGGAGAWHLGAHYADRWVAVSPGAGFAETAQYQRLRPRNYPPGYEQALWGVYDVPAYVRNLFNLPVIAYSGENDRQIQAAQVMEAAFSQNGRELTHLIGPGVEHVYEADTLKELLARIDIEVQRGRDPLPREVFLQTRTLRYARQFWIEATGLQQHWRDARIDARRSDEGKVQITTDNITHLRIWLPAGECQFVEIDGEPLDVSRIERPQEYLALERRTTWQVAEESKSSSLSRRKRPGQQGPIDDAFLEPFLVVTPTAPAQHPQIEQWQKFELEHLRERWRTVFRGELPEKKDTEVTEEDVARCHLILWGDPSSNLWIRMLLEESGTGLSLVWTKQHVSLGGHEVSASEHIPVLIFPSPFQGGRYVVLNSGPTFREEHDRTNSLQNPKLPDWAILRVDQPPDGTAAGAVVAADFFGERWDVRSP